jgi:hypothetical protein
MQNYSVDCITLSHNGEKVAQKFLNISITPLSMKFWALHIILGLKTVAVHFKEKLFSARKNNVMLFYTVVSACGLSSLLNSHFETIFSLPLVVLCKYLVRRVCIYLKVQNKKNLCKPNWWT